MELSSDVLRPFLDWGLRSDDEKVICNRRLHLLGTHDQMMCMIFLFLASFRFLTKMQFFTLRDLGQTTTNSTIIFLYFSRFPPLTDVALRRNRANTASDSFVLIARSFLLQFTKLDIVLLKSVIGAAIKSTVRVIQARGFSLCRFTRAQKTA